MIKADRPGRIYIILRNQQFQQINEWPENLEEDLEIKIHKWMHEEEQKQMEAAKRNETTKASKSAKAPVHVAANGTNATRTYSWVAVDDMCQIQKSRGLYPGEFMAWFNCTAS